MVSNLMNAVEGECLCLCEISIYVNKLVAVLLLPVYFFIPFFILMLLLHSCLFVDHVPCPLSLFRSFCLSLLSHHIHFRNNMSSTDRKILHNYGTTIGLNLKDEFDFVGFQDGCRVWLISLHLQLNKSLQETRCLEYITPKCDNNVLKFVVPSNTMYHELYCT